MQNIKTKSIKKLLAIFLLPMPIVLALCFKLGAHNYDLELNLLANSFIRQLEEQINDLRDENKQALYDAQNCRQIQKDLLFETSLREMLIIQDGKIVCSSKREASDVADIEQILPKKNLETGEYLFDLPTEYGVLRNLLVVDTDRRDQGRSAVSIVDQEYMNLQLAVNDDNRIKALQITVGGKTHTTDKSGKNTSYSVTAISKSLDIQVMLEPSDKFKRQEFNFILLVALPISLCISLFLFLLVHWLETKGSLLEALKKGVQNQEFFLVYQPILRGSDLSFHGVEALIRWRSSKHGLIGPDIFIPLAEQNNFINVITDFVLERALKDWQKVDHQHHLHVEINVPPSYLLEADCLNKFQYYAKKFNEHNLSLGIEITERQLLDTQGRSILSDIRALGIDVSIDDFGTGFTALSLLQDIKLDCLKIDRCFVKTIGVESINAPILNNIIHLARDLKVSIVAEGIETQTQLDYLRSQKVDYLQGFYLHKPMTLDALEAKFNGKI